MIAINETYDLAKDNEVVNTQEATRKADREANKLILPHQGQFAWPTVIMGALVVLSFLTVIMLASLKFMPLWLGLILNSLVLYAAQTPLHEACHGNIAGQNKSKMWLNHLIGYLCGWVLLHEYKAFRHLHLAHHRDPNNEELDPDTWIKVKHPLNVLFRCLTIVFYYNHFFFKNVAFKWKENNNKALAIHIIASYWVLYSIMFWFAVFGWWKEVLMLWLLPHYIASALIIFFFAYLVHEPHSKTARYKDTNLFLFKGWWNKIVTWAYCYQNYHLIHHLYPRIPFYKYPEAYEDVSPILKREKSHIYDINLHGTNLNTSTTTLSHN